MFAFISIGVLFTTSYSRVYDKFTLRVQENPWLNCDETRMGYYISFQTFIRSAEWEQVQYRSRSTIKYVHNSLLISRLVNDSSQLLSIYYLIVVYSLHKKFHMKEHFSILRTAFKSIFNIQ